MTENSLTSLNFKDYTILLVDDTPANLWVLIDYLGDRGFDIMTARSGENALKKVKYAPPDIILLDVMMPGLSGFETCQRLKANEASRNIPVIFMTALSASEDKIKGFKLGAVDYVTKPLQQEEVFARVTAHLQIRNLAQNLEKTNERLASLNTDKERFFSSIYQDLNAPFTTLLSNAYTLYADLPSLEPEQIQAMTQQIYTSGGTINNLVETLMTWSTLQRTHLNYPASEVDLRDIAQKVVALYQETATRKNIELTNDIVEDNLFACGDEFMLAVILRNLMANALKFTLSGGWITLSARTVDLPIEGQEQIPGEFIEVTVTDMGIGMSQGDLAKLFRIDVQHTTPGTAQETAGSGLGLMMSKEMVEYQGGQIWLESQPGRGMTVRFTVPIAKLEGCV